MDFKFEANGHIVDDASAVQVIQIMSLHASARHCTLLARTCTPLHAPCTPLHASARSLHATARLCTLLHATARYCTPLHAPCTPLHATARVTLTGVTFPVIRVIFQIS
jgi:hypothetical protein